MPEALARACSDGPASPPLPCPASRLAPNRDYSRHTAAPRPARRSPPSPPACRLLRRRLPRLRRWRPRRCASERGTKLSRPRRGPVTDPCTSPGDAPSRLPGGLTTSDAARAQAAPKKETNPLFEKRPKTFGEQRERRGSGHSACRVRAPAAAASRARSSGTDVARGRCGGTDPAAARPALLRRKPAGPGRPRDAADAGATVRALARAPRSPAA